MKERCDGSVILRLTDEVAILYNGATELRSEFLQAI